VRRLVQGVNWRYAVAEFAIIVVGILLAVQIDRWDTGRERADVAQGYLDRLVRDLQEDTRLLQANADKYASWSEHADQLLLWMEDPESPPPEDSLALTINSARGGRVSRLQGPTYRDLVSGGNLSLFEAPDLRDSVISYYESVPAAVDADIDFMKELIRALFSSMGRHIDDRVLLGRETPSNSRVLIVTDWRSLATDALVGQQLRLWASGTHALSAHHLTLAERPEELLERVLAAGGRSQ
jgi:hypothetical protein